MVRLFLLAAFVVLAHHGLAAPAKDTQLQQLKDAIEKVVNLRHMQDAVHLVARGKDDNNDKGGPKKSKEKGSSKDKGSKEENDNDPARQMLKGMHGLGKMCGIEVSKFHGKDTSHEDLKVNPQDLHAALGMVKAAVNKSKYFMDEAIKFVEGLKEDAGFSELPVGDGETVDDVGHMMRMIQHQAHSALGQLLCQWLRMELYGVKEFKNNTYGCRKLKDTISPIVLDALKNGMSPGEAVRNKEEDLFEAMKDDIRCLADELKRVETDLAKKDVDDIDAAGPRNALGGIFLVTGELYALERDILFVVTAIRAFKCLEENTDADAHKCDPFLEKENEGRKGNKGGKGPDSSSQEMDDENDIDDDDDDDDDASALKRKLAEFVQKMQKRHRGRKGDSRGGDRGGDRGADKGGDSNDDDSGSADDDNGSAESGPNRGRPRDPLKKVLAMLQEILKRLGGGDQEPPSPGQGDGDDQGQPQQPSPGDSNQGTTPPPGDNGNAGPPDAQGGGNQGTVGSLKRMLAELIAKHQGGN